MMTSSYKNISTTESLFIAPNVIAAICEAHSDLSICYRSTDNDDESQLLVSRWIIEQDV